MSKSSHTQDVEYARILKILNFRLPPSFKKIGITGAFLILVFLIGYKFIGNDGLIFKEMLRTLILLFMLLASLSKDVLEDEFNKHVRYQSYVVAFVCATVYCISLPLLGTILDVAVTEITGDGQANFYAVSAFEVIFILLGFQILFFETLKRYGRA